MAPIHVPERWEPCQGLRGMLAFSRAEHGAACPPHPGPAGPGDPKARAGSPGCWGCRWLPSRGDTSGAQDRQSFRAGTEQPCILGRCSRTGWKAQGPGEAQNPTQGPVAVPLDAVQASCSPSSESGCSGLACSRTLDLFFSPPDPTAWSTFHQNFRISCTVFVQQLRNITIGFLRARQMNTWQLWAVLNEL